MRTVKEVSLLTGVSVRALHHYDAIGLLKPTRVTEAGYRLYDDAALERLQTILLFRELQFPLKEIRDILDRPDFDPADVMARQIRLLELRRQRLDRLISHARYIQKTGVMKMDFSPFDTTELDACEAEAKARWGNTEAYAEFQRKTGNQPPEAMEAAGKALMEIFARLGAIRHTAPDSPAAQARIRELRDFITVHFYTCTPEILRGLGQLYVSGDDMTKSIDAAGGEGTADFTQKAIEVFCGKRDE